MFVELYRFNPSLIVNCFGGNCRRFRLGPASYGVTIRREIESRTGRKVSLGSIYPTADRLETKGYLTSFHGEPTNLRGGRSKRHFRLEPAGMAVLRRSWKTLARMWEGYEPETISGGGDW